MPTQPSANMNASWTPSESMDSWGSSSGSPDQTTQQSPSSHATTSKTRPNMLSRDASSRSKSYSSSSNSPRRPKVKTQQNHRMVCHDCGATDTPQWRTGANGPGTLCNVCGLLFAKRTQLHVSQFN